MRPTSDGSSAATSRASASGRTIASLFTNATYSPLRGGGAVVAAAGVAEVVAGTQHGDAPHAVEHVDGVGGAAVVDQHDVDVDPAGGEHRACGLHQQWLLAPRQHDDGQTRHGWHSTARPRPSRLASEPPGRPRNHMTPPRSPVALRPTLLGALFDAVLDTTVVSLAIWTLLYSLGLPTQWSLHPSGWLWLLLTLGYFGYELWRVRGVVRR